MRCERIQSWLSATYVHLIHAFERFHLYSLVYKHNDHILKFRGMNRFSIFLGYSTEILSSQYTSNYVHLYAEAVSFASNITVIRFRWYYLKQIVTKDLIMFDGRVCRWGRMVNITRLLIVNKKVTGSLSSPDQPTYNHIFFHYYHALYIQWSYRGTSLATTVESCQATHEAASLKMGGIYTCIFACLNNYFYSAIGIFIAN